MSDDGNGGIYAAWEDNRTPALGVDVYAQHFDATGAELWEHNGIAVINDSLLQNRPKLTRDSQNNVTIVWEDFRTGTTLDLYGKKLSPTGTDALGRRARPRHQHGPARPEELRPAHRMVGWRMGHLD